MDNISDLLSSLSESDMESLKSVASSLLGSNNGTGPKNTANGSANKDDDESGKFNLSLEDPAMLAKIGSLMGGFNKDDSRCDFIYALKPHLSETRKKRADEAIRLIKLLNILPGLKDLGIFKDLLG